MRSCGFFAGWTGRSSTGADRALRGPSGTGLHLRRGIYSPAPSTRTEMCGPGEIVEHKVFTTPLPPRRDPWNINIGYDVGAVAIRVCDGEARRVTNSLSHHAERWSTGLGREASLAPGIKRQIFTTGRGRRGSPGWYSRSPAARVGGTWSQR